MPNVGWGELFVVLLVALIVFGPKRLPEMMKSLGKGIRAFQDETTRAVDTLREATEAPLESVHGVIDRPDGEIVGTERAAKSAPSRSSPSRKAPAKVRGRPSRSRATANGPVRAEAHEDT